MSFGLLAKDSIQDLASMGREAEEQENGSNQFTNNKEPEEDVFRDARSEDETSVASFHSTDGENITLNSSSPNSTAKKPLNETVDIASTTAAKKNDAPGSAQSVESGESVSSSNNNNYGAYSEFSAAYHQQHYQEYYDMSTYGPTSIGAKPANRFWQSLLPCLFPWTTNVASESMPPMLLTKDSMAPDEEASASESVPVVDDKLHRSMSSGDGDDVSTGSDALGEKLSDKERQAVLARLRLAQPEAGEESPGAEDKDSSTNKKGLLNDLPQYDPLGQPLPKMPTRGILKRGTATATSLQSMDNVKDGNSDKKGGKQPARRSLFPKTNYETVGTIEQRTNMNNVQFAPMARVVTVKSKNEMTMREKGAIWWQKADYEDFRKTGRIITKAMLEGGSELWLSSERIKAKSKGSKGKTKNEKSDSSEEDDDDAGDTITSTGDKWWHTFGHSRRGLEHVVSMEEGRQRQLNVRTAIRAVIDEQIRQKLYNRVDPEKLRMVSLQYTSWARDLALASGSSDADAVQSSFSNARKTREFYLLKMSRRNVSAATSGKHVPEFMQPALHGAQISKATAPHRLDAHTSAQIRYRRKSQQLPSSTASKVAEAFNKDAGVNEPLADRESGAESTMAQRAAGFFADDSGQKTDMAAVLSGMGAIPRSSRVVSTA